MDRVGELTNALGRLIGGRYRLTAEIGRGGMGVVWRAYDERLGREVAVKQLAVPPLSTDEERHAMVARAMQEARTAGSLDHPNIVAVYDVVEDAGHPCIVMRLVRGYPLDVVVAAAGPLPPDVVARLGLTILDALDAAHRAGVVHRDVKPANVLVQPDGTVLLSDFSIASVRDGGTRTAAGILLGTPGYIAPERLTQGTAGPPADLFGLGATLYLAVEGVEAFDTGDALSGLFAVATAPHRPPERAGALGPILDRLLIKDPAARTTADAAAEALRRIAAPDGRSLAALLATTSALPPVTGTGPAGGLPAAGAGPVPGAGPARPPLRPTTVAPAPPYAAPPYAAPPFAAPPYATPPYATPPLPGGAAMPGSPTVPGGSPMPSAPGMPGGPLILGGPGSPGSGGRRGAVGRLAALPRSAVAAAGVVVLLVIGLTAYVIASAGRNDPDASASPTRTVSPSASASPSASPTASVPAGLSAGEQQLWTTLAGRGIDKASCRSGPDSDSGPDSGNGGVTATLVCDTVGAPQTQVRYFAFESRRDYRDHFSDVNDYADDGSDHDCGVPGTEGYGDWGADGTVACYWTDNGTWWITWGDRDTLVGAEIQDTDPTAVADWWRQNSAFTA